MYDSSHNVSAMSPSRSFASLLEIGPVSEASARHGRQHRRQSRRYRYGRKSSAENIVSSAQGAGQIACGKMWCHVCTKNCSQGVRSMDYNLFVLGRRGALSDD